MKNKYIFLMREFPTLEDTAIMKTIQNSGADMMVNQDTFILILLQMAPVIQSCTRIALKTEYHRSTFFSTEIGKR